MIPEIEEADDGWTYAGRTEYESHELIQKKNLFEDRRPTEIYSWITEEGGGTGYIVSKRGSGKTLFLEKLKEEIPLTIGWLDKDSLRYELKISDEPTATLVLDDIHYLFVARRLDEVLYTLAKEEGDISEPPMSEDDMLTMLENYAQESWLAGRKVVFVADRGPQALMPYLQEEKNKRRWQNLTDGCVVDEQDAIVHQRTHGEAAFYGRRGELNVLHFRGEMALADLLAMKKEFNVKDIPVSYNKEYWTFVTPDNELLTTSDDPSSNPIDLQRSHLKDSLRRIEMRKDLLEGQLDIKYKMLEQILFRGFSWENRPKDLDEIYKQLDPWIRQGDYRKTEPIRRRLTPVHSDILKKYPIDGARVQRHVLSMGRIAESVQYYRKQISQLSKFETPEDSRAGLLHSLTTVRELSALQEMYGEISRDVLGIMHLGTPKTVELQIPVVVQKESGPEIEEEIKVLQGVLYSPDEVREVKERIHAFYMEKTKRTGFHDMAQMIIESGALNVEEFELALLVRDLAEE